MFNDWNWTDTWLAVLVVVCFSVLGLGAFAAFQDHSIRFYYLSDHGVNGGHNGYCIDGYREWYSNDVAVFCSDDINKTLTVVKEMNAELVHLHGNAK